MGTTGTSDPGQDDIEKSSPDVLRGDLKQDSGQTNDHTLGGAEAVWDEAFLVTFKPDNAGNPLN